MTGVPRVGLLLGDPCGIGPELVARLVRDGELDPGVATIVMGESRVAARGAEVAGIELRLPAISCPRRQRSTPGARCSWQGPRSTRPTRRSAR